MKSFAWAEGWLVLGSIEKPVMGVCRGALCVWGGVLHRMPHLPPHRLDHPSFCTYQSKASLPASAAAY